jgi:hypothetical protein
VIVIKSTPAGAAVRVDGVAKGVTPFMLETALGARHKIEILQGAQTELRMVEVSDLRSEVVVELAPVAKLTTSPSKPPTPATRVAPRPQVAKPETSSPPATEPKPVVPAQPPRPVFVD